MKEIALTFLLAWAGALAALTARLGYSIKDDLPPDDPALFAAWRRKRIWTLVAEFSTTPAFGAAWTAASLHWGFSVPVVVFGSMVSGAVGFGFCLDAIHRIVSRRLSNV